MSYSFDPQGNVVNRIQSSNSSIADDGEPMTDTVVWDAWGESRNDEWSAVRDDAQYAVSDPAGFGAQYGYQGEWESGLAQTWGQGGSSYEYYRYEPYLLTHRYLDPSTGKFASRDPIGTQGGENLYGYAGDNPVNEVDPSGDAAAAAVIRPLVWVLPRVAIPEAVGTVIAGASDAVTIAWGVEAAGEMGAYAATGGTLEGPTMRDIGEPLATLLIPPALTMAADPKARAILAFDRRLDSSGNYIGRSYEDARNAALEWLGEHGFSADRAVLSKGLAGTVAGKAIGMETSNGKVGFRVEWDPSSGAHINVWDENLPKGHQSGPHFQFPGTEAGVDKIQERFGQ